MRSLTTPMKAESLTTLRIQHDWKKGIFRFEAIREWDPELDFSKYNKDFYIESILCEDVIYLNTKQVRELYRRYRLEDYLDEICELVRQGRHFGIELYYHNKLNITYMSHQHNRLLGINNRYHATLAGGIRRHSPEESEKEVIIDGLNLGRGMSFKNIAGHLSFGGCKQTVTMDPIDLSNMEVMGFLGFCIDRCRTMTGPDMNFPTEMADVENANYSMNYTNGPSSPLGETGKPTAYGVYITMKQAVKFKEGTDSLDGKSVVLIGLGAVGWYMGEYLLQEDISLSVADINPDVIKRFLKAHPDKNIKVISLEEAYTTETDILCPCAIGGVFDEDNIPLLRCSYIWGSANNQLKASSQDEEIRLAKQLEERGILFQTEWWHNTAGVICGAQEYMFGEKATYAHLIETIDKIMPESTWDNLCEARDKGITPCENVYRKCETILYQ